MKTLQVSLPDALAMELERTVAGGWFEDAGEAVREAVREFLAARRYALLERQQLDDVAWAEAIAAERR